MKTIFKFIALAIFAVLQGCASIQNLDFSEKIDYDYLESLDESSVLSFPSYNAKIIDKRVIRGDNEMSVMHVVCIDNKCTKDDKYFVYIYLFDGYVNPDGIERSSNLKSIARRIEKFVMNKDKLQGTYEIMDVHEAKLKIELEQKAIQQKEINKRNAKIEAENQRKREQYMASAKYAPQIQIRRKVDYSCGMSCYQTTMKEVTSTDNVPFRVNSVTINGRCDLIHPTNRVLNLGDSFIIPEFDAPYPAGCGKVLKITLKTNRGTFDYDLR